MARKFNGSTSVVTVPSGVGYWTTNGTMSVSFWLNTETPPMDYGGLFITSGQKLYLRTTRKFSFYGNTAVDPIVMTALTTRTWYHFAYTFPAGASVTQTFYLNGASLATLAAGQSGGGASIVYVGNDVPNTPRYFGGSIADLAIWRAELTPNEILMLAAGVRAKYIRADSLSGYWPMTGLTPNEPDVTPFAHNGTLITNLFAPDPPFIPNMNEILIMPPEGEMSVLSGVAPSFISGWSRQSNLPVIGGGTF